MFDFNDFLSHKKSLLIAPAGYGKTHTIAECIVWLQHSGRQLVLTHTHAGVASLREKIAKQGVSSRSYNVETISSFAQRYVMSFTADPEKYQVNQGGAVFAEIVNVAISLFRTNPIRRVVESSYAGLFVDEYQDCTVAQHELIMVLSESLKTRIFGDPMQGIFGFGSEGSVDLNDKNQMMEFADNRYELDQPQRWIHANNPVMGAEMASMREALLNRREIVLGDYSSIEMIKAYSRDIYTPHSDYNRRMREILKGTNVLIIHPDQTSINPRMEIVKRFSNIPTLIESIDDKDFYAIARSADEIVSSYSYEKMYALMCKLFNATGMNYWFSVKGAIKKRKPDERKRSEDITKMMEAVEIGRNSKQIEIALKAVSSLKNIKCYRRELLSSLLKALNIAEYENILIEEAMIGVRNSIRRYGRRLTGRCIGTTLLTKGLECETVVIVDAHKIICERNFYVAVTRATKKLYVFTETNILSPYAEMR